MDRAMWVLTIDFWRSRGWLLAGTLLLPMLLPLIVYGVLFSLVKDDWQHDPSTVMMHVVFAGIMALCIVGSLLASFDSLGREYTLPITTWRLVLTRSIGGTWVAAMAYALACLMMNGLFQAAWPFQGPVLLIIALYLAAQAVHLLTMKSQALGLLAFAPLCLISAWWLMLRYQTGGFLPGGVVQRLQMWTHVTWGERLTLLLVGVGGVWGSFYAARLQRMGSGPTMAGLVEALIGDHSRSGRTALPNLTTYQSALSWREWRERGRAIPCLFATAVLIYGCLWWLSRTTEEATAMGGGLSMMAAGSFWLWGGYLGMRSRKQDFPSFDGTRPITDAQWSKALLRNMTRSTLTACGVWILGAGLVVVIAWGVEGESLAIALGNSLGHEFANFKLADLYKLAVLIGKLAVLIGLWGLICWTFSANGMMLALLRRETTIVIVPGGLALFILTMIVTTVWVPQQLQGIVVMSLWGIFFTVLVLATIGSFVAARRRELIGNSTCWLCLTAWMVLTPCILTWMVSSLQLASERPFACFALGSLLMLPFLPIAATPLAVAWNRHR